MVSFCLKSFNKNTLSLLESYFEDSSIPDVLYSLKKFKKSYSLVIHYLGTKPDFFCTGISDVLSNFIIDHYENKILQGILKYDFFYFSDSEHYNILNNTEESLNLKENMDRKKYILQCCINNLHNETKKYNIDGLIHFRIQEYKSFIGSILETRVHDFVVNKEYNEYVSLLKEYIDVKDSQTDIVHLIYTSSDKVLLDDSWNIITTTQSKKYISDISFSSNDFILNSLLALVPKKILIHMQCAEDNFIQFLTQIFENRCIQCSNCNLCKTYKLHN